MDFALNEEQTLLVETVRKFVAAEMIPHEELLERTDEVPASLRADITGKARALGLYACNMPEDWGGGGLGEFDVMLVEKELGRTSMALADCCWRPSNVLRACSPEQRERWLLPAVRAERKDCVAMTEPDAGSDVRGMKASAVRDGEDWVINGTKHFISGADVSDFIILFVSTGEEDTPRGPKKRITAFLVDHDTPGVEVRRGYHAVCHRGHHNCIINLDNVRVTDAHILGEEGKGFDVANEWLYATRVVVAAMCCARAERALEIALDWAAKRKQFGQIIGKFQGVSFQLADMEVDVRLSNLSFYETAWKLGQGVMTDQDAAVCKLFCSEACGRVADAAIQVVGGMGMMADMPLERIWRDARVDRIWEGTSEIQRHVISRAMLRPLGA
ncbi:MAG: acyl-CoA dehydrogenase family protein [Rhodospirillales bacterium]